MDTTKLVASERPQIYVRYTVTGTGSFPLDMLRYDCAWPIEHEELMLRPTDGTHEPREVRLASYRLPTKQRWESFGWYVK